MLKKIWAVFIRDIKVNSHDAIALFIIVFPLVFAIGINLIIPGINDTTVNVAMVEGDAARAAFFDRFANVELLSSSEAVEERVGRRDSVFGIVEENGASVILVQGNESESLVDYAKLINVLFESGAELENAHSEISEFGRTVPPIKKLMVNALLLFVSVFAGMIIALNILEEKMDHTVSAVNVTPLPRTAFILGKSITGLIFAVVMSAVCILITGFTDVNFGQALLVIGSLTVLSLMIGFLQGLNSSDVMEAAGSVKLMFMPMLGSIIGYEMLPEKWQFCLYWSPFYWAYRANDLILTGGGDWPTLLLHVAIILAVCIIVFAALRPRIRKGLQ